jgi:hypothetical protein
MEISHENKTNIDDFSNLQLLIKKTQLNELSQSRNHEEHSVDLYCASINVKQITKDILEDSIPETAKEILENPKYEFRHFLVFGEDLNHIIYEYNHRESQPPIFGNPPYHKFFMEAEDLR